MKSMGNLKVVHIPNVLKGYYSWTVDYDSITRQSGGDEERQLVEYNAFALA